MTFELVMKKQKKKWTSSRRRQSPQPPILIFRSVPYPFFDFHVHIPIFLNFFPFFLILYLLIFHWFFFFYHYSFLAIKNLDFYLWHSFNVYVFSRTSKSLYHHKQSLCKIQNNLMVYIPVYLLMKTNIINCFELTRKI